MKLEQQQTIWGIPILKLKEYCKRYRIVNTILYVFYVLLCVFFIVSMYVMKVDNITYFTVMTIWILVCVISHNVFLNPQRWQIYKFFMQNKKHDVELKYYNITEDNMYSILYCMGYRRTVMGKKMETYIDMILSACNEDVYYARKIMKYMVKYECEEDDSNISAYVLIKKKKSYFIEFKVKGEKEDDYNTRTVE